MAEVVSLSNLSPFSGSKRVEKRVGRGIGSGHGKTSCRGQKGQGSRSGGRVPPWFEGGQMPILRRLPKRGFKNPFKVEYVVINVGELGKHFESGEVVDLEALYKKGILKGKRQLVKILGDGDISIPLTIKVHAISKSAKDK